MPALEFFKLGLDDHICMFFDFLLREVVKSSLDDTLDVVTVSTIDRLQVEHKELVRIQLSVAETVPGAIGTGRYSATRDSSGSCEVR